MRDEQGFRKFAAERVGALRRQALLLTGSAAEAAALTDDALADTARRWDSLPAGGAEEHARRALATGAVRRRAARTRRRGLVGLVAPAAVEPERTYERAGRGLVRASGARPAGPAGTAGAARAAGTATARPPATARPSAGGTATTTGAAVAGTGTGPTTDVDAAWRSLGALPARRRAVLVLRYDEALDDTAVAARLGLAPAAVAAEADAGLGALRSLLRTRGAPEQLVPAALAAAPDVPPPTGDPAEAALARTAHDRRRRGLTAAVAGMAVLAVAAAVVVPLATGDDPAPAGELPAAAPAGPGLLDWPARGPLAGDTELLRSALAAWRTGVPAGQAPAGAAVLYAGSPDGTPVVLLQGLDRAGLGWVAEVSSARGAPALVRAEPIGRVAPVLALSVADTGRVRLLAPADASRDGGLLTRPAEVTGAAPLRRLPLDADGLSDPLDAGRTGTPVVVVRGAGVDSIVAGSGTVLAGRLNPTAGTVEVGSARLGFGRSTDVRADWYTDGALVAGVLDGAVTVAALGPELTGALGGKPAHARTYEVQHAGDTWISSVVRVGGVSCVDSSRLGTVTPGADVPVVVRRCAPAGSAAGMLHVLAGRQVASVRIVLGIGAKGQRAVQLTVDRRTPGARDAGDGFTVLVALPALPTGAAQVQALDAAGRAVALVPLRPYRAPRG